MKCNTRKWIMTFVFLCFSSWLLAENTDIEALTERVKELENTISNIQWIGIPALGVTTILGVVMWLWGIKKKVLEVIEKEAKKELESKAEEFVEKKISAYPFIAEFEQKLAVKQKTRILLLGRSKKKGSLARNLKSAGFNGKMDALAIDNFNVIDGNDYDVIIFNNFNKELTFEEIDEVANSYNELVCFLYYGEGRWKNDTISKEMKGFASTPSTLDQNLTNLLLKQV